MPHRPSTVTDASSRVDPGGAAPALRVRLTRQEIEHFALEGYVVKRGVLDPGDAARAVDLMWSLMPEQFRRDDPATWRGKVTDLRGAVTLRERLGQVKLREEVWGQPLLDELLTRNTEIHGMVEQLLGTGRVEMPDRFRGYYPTFPTPEHGWMPVIAHVDHTRDLPFQVCVAAYFDTVVPRGGGFTVWPRSHRTLFYHSQTLAVTEPSTKRWGFRRAFHRINRTIPVELTGRAGDIILFHNCLAHAPGLNLVPGQVRHAGFINYRTRDAVARALQPRTPAIWDDWDGIRALDSAVVDASVLPMAPEEYRPRRRVNYLAIKTRRLLTKSLSRLKS